MRVQRFLARAAGSPAAVVLPAAEATALGIIRDLGRHGVPVLALDPDPSAAGLHSRFAAGMVCPPPGDDEEALVGFLEWLGPRLPSSAVVFPTADAAVWTLSKHADRLAPWYLLPFARSEVMEQVFDRRRLIEAAHQAGVDVPRTMIVETAGELDGAAAEVGLPALLRPARPPAAGGRSTYRALEIRDRRDLEAAAARVEEAGTSIYQELIPGDDGAVWAVGSYLDVDSRPMAVFTGREVRRHPTGSGACRLAASAWDPELAQTGVRLLQQLAFWGVSRVEFKRDARDGRALLTRVTARHWPWHALATRCGVNLSLTAYADVTGRPFTTPPQISGPRWSLAGADLSEGLVEVVHGERGLAPWLTEYRDVKLDGVLSPADPWPAARTVSLGLLDWAARGAGRGHGKRSGRQRSPNARLVDFGDR